MIINIRGTNGSGKTWVIRQLLNYYGHVPLRGRDGKINAHALGCGARVIGRYVKDDGTDLPTGGCDNTIKIQSEVEDLVRFHARRGHVLFEGIMISTLFGRWDAFARTIEDMRFVFLSTPLKKCIARTEARRTVAGNVKPLNPENLIAKYHAIERTRVKLTTAGQATCRTTSDEALELIQGWLGPASVSVVPPAGEAVGVGLSYTVGLG